MLSPCSRQGGKEGGGEGTVPYTGNTTQGKSSQSYDNSKVQCVVQLGSPLLSVGLFPLPRGSLKTFCQRTMTLLR